MKKIKGLLFGIVSMLGIGCSFGTYWQNDVDYNIGFYVKNLDFISNYGFGAFSVNSNNDGLSFNLGSNYYYSNCSHPNNCSESEIFSINSVGDGTPSVFRYGKFYYGSGFYSIYTFNGSSGTIFNMLNSSNYSISQAISPTDGNFSNSIDYYYTRLFLDSFNVSQDGFANWLASGFSWGGVSAEKYQIFSSSFASQVIRSDGLKYDCLVLNGQNIEECSKTFVSAGFTDGYSFVISDDSEFRFRSVLNGFADSYSYYISSGQNQYQSGYTLDGVYIMKLNNFGVINTGNYIMSMALDGDSLNFSLYDCPNNSLSINSCLFVKGGTITSDFSSSDFRSFIYAPTFHYNGGFRGNSFHIVNYYNPVNGKLYLYRGTSYMGYLEYDFDGFSSFTLDLIQSTENPNILNNFIEYSPDPGNGNQSTYSGSVSLDNCIDTQVCYDTTGDNGDVLHICTTKCIDSGSIISGSYVGSDGTIYYVDSSYNVGNISNSDGTIYDTGFLDEDGILSIDYYSGLFNGNGFRFGVCPYPPSNYLDFAVKIKLGNFYPFMPLNCFISAFQQGVKVHYFDDSGLFPDNHSQLMAGDSHYHKTLFRFFDVLLSIGILLLLSALLRIIKK